MKNTPNQSHSVSWIGVDVSKGSLDIDSSETDVSIPPQLVNSSQGFKRLCKKLQSVNQPHIVVEATGGYEKPFLQHLQSKGIACSRINPAHSRHYAKSKGILAKTDPIDAKLLTDYGKTFSPDLTSLTPPLLEKTRALLKYRRQLNTAMHREKMQLEHELPAFLTKMIKGRIRSIKKHIAKIDNEINSIVQTSPVLSKSVDILSSVRGVGNFTAVALISFMPELGRLNRNQVAALSGLAPINRDSGKLRGLRTIQGGRSDVRQSVYMAAVVSCRHNPVLRELYQRLRAKGKPAKVAITAVMRRLIIHLNSLMKQHLSTDQNLA